MSGRGLGRTPLIAFVLVAVVAVTGIATAAFLTTSAPSDSPVTVTTIGVAPISTGNSQEPGSTMAQFNGITCPSATVCIGVGSAPSGRASVATSTDGGRTWRTARFPASARSLTAVSCLRQRICVAVGDGMILKSTDSGTTWRVATHDVPNEPILAVDCTGSDECLTAGFDPSTQGAARGEIYRSLDGGATWVSVSLPGAAFGLGSVTCPTARECIAVGDSIFVTNDAGFTWHAGSVPLGFGTLSSVSCADSSDCVAVGPNAASASDPNLPANAIETLDGGQTWQSVAMPPATASIRSVSCDHVTCLAAGSGMQVGQPAVFLARNGTAGSFAQVPGPPSMTFLGSVLCGPRTGCMAVGATATHATTAAQTNGNSSWSVTRSFRGGR